MDIQATQKNESNIIINNVVIFFSFSREKKRVSKSCKLRLRAKLRCYKLITQRAIYVIYNCLQMKKMEREKKKEKSFYLMAGIRQTNLTGHIERKMYPKVVYFVAVCVQVYQCYMLLLRRIYLGVRQTITVNIRSEVERKKKKLFKKSSR